MPHKILLLPGDGIGPEVMAEAKRLLAWLGDRRGIAGRDEGGQIGLCRHSWRDRVRVAEKRYVGRSVFRRSRACRRAWSRTATTALWLHRPHWRIRHPTAVHRRAIVQPWSCPGDQGHGDGIHRQIRDLRLEDGYWWDHEDVQSGQVAAPFVAHSYARRWFPISRRRGRGSFIRFFAEQGREAKPFCGARVYGICPCRFRFLF